MIPRKPLSFRQEIAQGVAVPMLGFASAARVGKTAGKGAFVQSAPCLSLNCNLSLPFRSGPDRVGPAFATRVARETAAAVLGLWITKNFLFPSMGNALTLAPIKTPTRGRTSCTNPSLCLPFLPCRLPAVLTIPQRAALPGLPAARWCPTRLAATPLPARSSAGLRVLPRAASMSAWANATDQLTANRRLSPPRPSGHPARMAFLHV